MELELVKLVLALQVFLSGETNTLDYQKPDLWREVSFLTEAGETLSPQDWATGLVSRQACGARLALLPRGDDDRLLEAFANGGSEWLIEIRFPDHVEYWQPTDHLIQPRPEHGPIWFRTFSMTRARAPMTLRDQTVDAAITALSTALISIADYAEQDGQTHWADTFFRPALDILSGAPLPEENAFQQSISNLPASDRNIRALHAAMRSWVFGGMGSWNDIYPSDDLARDYETTSAALHAAFQNLMLAVANDAAPAACPTP